MSRRSDELLRQQLDRSRQDEVTYQEVGQTQSDILPTGYRHDRVISDLKAGDAGWENAKEAIRLWKAHAHAGIEITPSNALIQEGSTVLVSRSFGPVTLVAPCRIVYVTDDPDRYGFGYGTLPGHPERGEESFHVVRASDGTLKVEIVAFSRPADLLTELADPAAREIQKAATRRYLQGIEKHILGRS